MKGRRGGAFDSRKLTGWRIAGSRKAPPALQMGGGEGQRGQPESLKGKPKRLKGKPESLKGKPESLKGKPERLKRKPKRLKGKPKRLRGKPESLKGKPKRLRGKPKRLKGKPERLRGKPEWRRGKPKNGAGGGRGGADFGLARLNRWRNEGLARCSKSRGPLDFQKWPGMACRQVRPFEEVGDSRNRPSGLNPGHQTRHAIAWLDENGPIRRWE